MSEQHPPAWALRLRTERETREWNKKEMARRLLRAAGYQHGSIDSLARQIRNWEHGKHFPRDWAHAYATAFNLHEQELFETGNQPSTGQNEEAEPMKRREALKLGAFAAIAPEMVQRVLRDAAAEAMEFTRLAGTSTLGAGTLAHLEAVVDVLDTDFRTASPAELFALVHAYRRRVGELIQGRHTLSQGRELYVYAASLSEMLAWLSNDLGDRLAGEAWAIDSYEHAGQAGHNELCAWATDAMASIAIYADRPDRAIIAAHRGIAKLPAHHPLTVRLLGQAARAHARRGQREECEQLLREAAERYERLSAGPAPADKRAASAMTSYPASAYIWLGDAERGDFDKAKAHAQSAITVYEALPEVQRDPSREAIARIDLGIALTALGAPDEAAALGHQALTTTRLVDTVRSRAADLDQALTTRYPELGLAQDFHEAYQQTTHPRTDQRRRTPAADDPV